MILLGRSLNGKPQLLGSGTGSAGSSGSTGSGSTGSGSSSGSTTPGAMSQAFSLSNWGSATTLGLHKRGVWFRKGDVPAGSIPVLSSGAVQLYGLTRWSDGSLKTARLLLRDAGLVAGASRSYTMTAATGTLSGAARTQGNGGLVAALSGRAFKITFSSVKDSGGATYGGGTLVADLATHAAVSTRWDLLSSGAVADVWQGWGMAGSDAHLKVYWYLTRWKAADGSTLAWQIGAEPALDWWSVAGKTDLTYDAALADGSTTILSYAGVQHYYHSRWLMCVNDGSLNAGTAPWVGATQPTLHCAYDKAYAVSTGLIPPYRTTKTPTPAPQYAYVPCNVVAEPGADHLNSHRTAIDGVGLYQGRGPLTRFDADAFMAQSPAASAVARLNALTGLSVPYHYRSNRTRTRPGESADTASTNIVLLMAPKAASASDFTAQGLPIAVDAYRGSSSGTDGFVYPTRLAGNPWGEGSLEASHGVSYCYYAGLTTGEEWFVEAQIDLALNLAHQGIATYHQHVAPFALTYNPATPSAQWTGLLGQWHEYNLRYVGWSQLIQGHGFGLLPVDHPYAPAAAALRSHQGDYIGTVLDYLPADFAAAGAYYPESGSLFSPWMGGFGAIGAYAHYLCNEDARWKRLGDHIATWTIAQAAAGRWYCWDIYRTAVRNKNAAWNASSNPTVPATQQGYLQLTPNADASTDRLTQVAGNQWNVNGNAPPPPRAGDRVIVTSLNDGGNAGPTLPDVAEGTVTYMVNLTPGSGFSGRYAPTTPPSWQLSLTPGGAPIDFGTSVSGLNLATVPQSVTEWPVAQAGADYLAWPYLPAWDNYVPVHLSVLMMARQAGNTLATATLRSGALAFVAGMDANTSYYSAFDMATAA